MSGNRELRALLVAACMACATVSAEPVWVVDPGNPGPDAPPQGRSLFDHLTIRDGVQHVPYPFEALREHLATRLDADDAYLGQPVKQVVIPLGRSLQREAAAPHYFASPRIVIGIDAEPLAADAGAPLLRDRLFIGYLEAAHVLEIISYNEAAARFEFQVVHDYRANGRPEVRYARRVVCMACHQNAAPIFARPLWDETNANDDVARRLAMVRDGFHGIPARTGVDVAYAIDNATDRANGFALTQKLWREGCGAQAPGVQCRSALLTRVLQFALNGGRGFDRGSDDYLAQLRAPMLRQRGRLWPDGLLVPDGDIPNRKPLGAGALLRHPDDAGLAPLADVSAAVEPLEARPAPVTWSPAPDAWVERAVSGLRQFLAMSDILHLDRALERRSSPHTRITVDCDLKTERRATQSRYKIACQGNDLELRGLVYAAHADRRISGQLRGVRVQGEDLGTLEVGGDTGPGDVLTLQLGRPGLPGRPRLAGGDAIGPATLQVPDAGAGHATLRLEIRHDFQHLQAAVHRLADRRDAPLDDSPFRRAVIVPALLEALGEEPPAACCAHDLPLPVPRVSASEPPPDDALLYPLFKVCGACHRAPDPFPPNFLAGTADQVRRSVAQCAERIQFRLAMWDQAPASRAKTPMPPQHARGMDASRSSEWMTRLLPELRAALDAVARAAGQALGSPEQLLNRPYHTLRPCVPHA